MTAASSWNPSGSTARTNVSGPVMEGVSRRDSCWVPFQMLLVAGPRPNEAIAKPTGGQGCF